MIKRNYYGGLGCKLNGVFFHGNVQTGGNEERHGPEQDKKWVFAIFTLAKLVLLSVM